MLIGPRHDLLEALGIRDVLLRRPRRHAREDGLERGHVRRRLRRPLRQLCAGVDRRRRTRGGDGVARDDCFSCKWPRKLAVRLWWSTSTKPSVPRSSATERNHARPVLNCVSILKAFESRRSGLRWALGSMAKSVPPCAAFGEVWRCISECCTSTASRESS